MSVFTSTDTFFTNFGSPLTLAVGVALPVFDQVFDDIQPASRAGSVQANHAFVTSTVGVTVPLSDEVSHYVCVSLLTGKVKRCDPGGVDGGGVCAVSLLQFG